MKLGLTVFFIYALTLVCPAQNTITSVGSGDWSSPQTWDVKRIPGDNDIIVIQAGHSLEIKNHITLKNVTLRVIGTMTLHEDKSVNLNSASVINVISGGRIRSNNSLGQAAILLGGAAKFRSSKVFNSAWGPGVINGLAYATSTTGNIDQSGIGFILGNLPAVWQDFNLFKTTDGQIQMVWVTSHETGTRTFNVERSVNAQSWNIIGRIESAGNMGSQNIYNFVDSDPGTGIVYYRVREIDPDGIFKLSSVRSVRLENNITSHRVYPNPATNYVKVTYNKTTDSNTSLQIYNVQGQTLKSLLLPRGSSLQNLDISSLKQGLYMIQVRYSDGSSEQHTLVKY